MAPYNIETTTALYLLSYKHEGFRIHRRGRDISL